MNHQKFDNFLQKKQRVWNVALILILLSAAFGAATIGWFYGDIITAILSAGVGGGLAISILKPIDTLLRRTVLKEYWIEVCGSVVKLHGSVRLLDTTSAYRDIHKVRPGLKIIDDAYSRFGCTLAAVPATQAELDAKKELDGLGVNVKTIG